MKKSFKISPANQPSYRTEIQIQLLQMQTTNMQLLQMSPFRVLIGY